MCYATTSSRIVVGLQPKSHIIRTINNFIHGTITEMADTKIGDIASEQSPSRKLHVNRSLSASLTCLTLVISQLVTGGLTLLLLIITRYKHVMMDPLAYELFPSRPVTIMKSLCCYLHKMVMQRSISSCWLRERGAIVWLQWCTFLYAWSGRKLCSKRTKKTRAI